MVIALLSEHHWRVEICKGFHEIIISLGERWATKRGANDPSIHGGLPSLRQEGCPGPSSLSHDVSAALQFPKFNFVVHFGFCFGNIWSTRLRYFQISEIASKWSTYCSLDRRGVEWKGAFGMMALEWVIVLLLASDDERSVFL